ncbi:hypothetical protein HCU01_29320 [Halomonas cupida]|uniref:Uncharacterized protein n=1 Tax=Halomonas cupida TaxID=44933 RepID=A0ABQ0WK14_9GAMM|nr:hypothetical protein HCU01_29320 [Halomonas cupida]
MSCLAANGTDIEGWTCESLSKEWFLPTDIMESEEKGRPWIIAHRWERRWNRQLRDLVDSQALGTLGFDAIAELQLSLDIARHRKSGKCQAVGPAPGNAQAKPGRILEGQRVCYCHMSQPEIAGWQKRERHRLARSKAVMARPKDTGFCIGQYTNLDRTAAG